MAEVAQPSARTWSDTDLAAAVRASANWRDVMRTLELNPYSAGAIRIIRRQAELLGLDMSHFRRRRPWSEAQLRRAVIDARSWDEVLPVLGLAPQSADGRTRVKAHAIRLGLDLSHLADSGSTIPEQAEVKPDLRYLRDAATAIAASWFSLCGFNVAIPVEPAVYDLLVSMPGGIKRVQVKTTTCMTRDGWMVAVGRRPYSAGNTERQIPYDPEFIDWFFIVDGDLKIYLIPSKVIAGRVRVLLRTYSGYVVASAAGFMAPQPGAA
jgi:PD-(D/E)XK endonuclease